MANDKLRMTPLAREIDAAAEKLEEIEARLGTPNEQANDLELARVYGHDLRNLLMKLHGKLFAIAKSNEAEGNSDTAEVPDGTYNDMKAVAAKF